MKITLTFFFSFFMILVRSSVDIGAWKVGGGKGSDSVGVKGSVLPKEGSKLSLMGL